MRSAKLIDFVWKHLCVNENCVIYSMQIPKDDLNIHFLLCCVSSFFYLATKKLFCGKNISWHERSKKAFAKPTTFHQIIVLCKGHWLKVRKTYYLQFSFDFFVALDNFASSIIWLCWAFSFVFSLIISLIQLMDIQGWICWSNTALSIKFASY